MAHLIRWIKIRAGSRVSASIANLMCESAIAVPADGEVGLEERGRTLGVVGPTAVARGIGGPHLHVVKRVCVQPGDIRPRPGLVLGPGGPIRLRALAILHVVAGHGRPGGRGPRDSQRGLGLCHHTGRVRRVRDLLRRSGRHAEDDAHEGGQNHGGEQTAWRNHAPSGG